MPLDSSDIDAALMALLQNDSELHALLPDGVFDEEGVPPDAVQFVSVALAEHEDKPVFGGRGWETAQYVVEAVSRSGVLTNMKAAAARIDALLEDGALAVPGFMAMFRERRTRTTDRDVVDKTVRWFRRGGFYRVQVAVEE